MPYPVRPWLPVLSLLCLLAPAALAAPPVVKVLMPSEGRHFGPDERILLAANPAEEAAGIVKVTWQVDGRDVGQAAAPPFQLIIPVPARGRHTVRAIATMKDGSRVESAPVSFRSVGPPYEGWDLEFEVVGPGETPKAREPRKPPVAAPGAPQGLCLAIDNSEIDPLPGDGEGCVGEIFEIVTSDGRPPVNQAARLPLEGNVSSDAQVRRLGAFRYDQKAKAWVGIPGAKVNEETLEVVVPVAQTGRYAVAGVPGAPRRKPVVRWLNPAEGATVRGKVDILAQVVCDDNLVHDAYTLEKTGDPPLKALATGLGEGPEPFFIIPQSWELPLEGSHFDISPPPAAEAHENGVNVIVPVEGAFSTNFDLVATGTYRLVATIPGDKGEVRSVRNFRVVSPLKLPTVAIDPKTLRADGDTGDVEGTVSAGTLSVREILLVHDGILVGRAEVYEAFGDHATGKPARPMRWRGRFYAPVPPKDGSPVVMAAVAVDEMGNRSAPAKLAITRPAKPLWPQTKAPKGRK